MGHIDGCFHAGHRSATVTCPACPLLLCMRQVLEVRQCSAFEWPWVCADKDSLQRRLRVVPANSTAYPDHVWKDGLHFMVVLVSAAWRCCSYVQGDHDGVSESLNIHSSFSANSLCWRWLCFRREAAVAMFLISSLSSKRQTSQNMSVNVAYSHRLFLADFCGVVHGLKVR